MLTNSSQKESGVTKNVSGTFDVKVNPLEDKTDPTIGRMSIDKQYHGPMEGTGKGQMLTGSTEIQGSAVYVAIERVNGKLDGKSGSFAFDRNVNSRALDFRASSQHLTLAGPFDRAVVLLVNRHTA